LVVSPEVIRDYFLPFYKDITRLAHDQGIKVVFHSEGGIARILLDLVKIGVDVLHPVDEVGSDMDVRRVYKRVEGHIRLWYRMPRSVLEGAEPKTGDWDYTFAAWDLAHYYRECVTAFQKLRKRGAV
jgi:hypothetical protein